MGLLKCPKCECRFCHESDRTLHIQTHWKTTKKGDAEIIDSVLLPVLASKLKNMGSFVEAGYRYALIGNGEIIYRTQERPQY